MRNHNYRVWTAGSVVSNVGTWMQRVAQDWLVLTQLTHHDASALGFVTALQFAPQLLLLPWSGDAADRFNQRRLLMATQATMGVLALTLGALTITGIVQLWHVYVFAFVFGAAAALDAPVRQTFVAELVSDDEDLPSAVSLNSISFNAARMVGPAATGLVIAQVGTGWAFLINGISFAAVLISMSLFRMAELRANARASPSSGGFMAGLRYVWRRPDLRGILIMLFLIGTFGLNFAIFISTMAVSVFHTDARGFGLLSSIMAVGTIAGALLAGAGRPRFASLLVGAGVFGVGCTLGAFAPDYWWFAGALVVVGIAALILTNNTNSMMQLTTEPEMRGRVMAFRVAVALGGTPIGAPFVGWVANRFGPRWALGVGAASGFAAAMMALYIIMDQRIRRRNGHCELADGSRACDTQSA
jgi:MFS family permease